MAGTSSPSLGKIDAFWKIAIVRSSWHPECVRPMADEALAELLNHGIARKNIFEVEVPGSFEIPLACKHVIQKKHVNAVIAFGVIVQGQTHHARLLAEQAAAGIMQVQLETGVPIAFEVLFVDDIGQAKARSSGEYGKGPIAARTVLATLAKLADLG